VAHALGLPAGLLEHSSTAMQRKWDCREAFMPNRVAKVKVLEEVKEACESFEARRRRSVRELLRSERRRV
jgi:hypothetical protein